MLVRRRRTITFARSGSCTPGPRPSVFDSAEASRFRCTSSATTWAKGHSALQWVQAPLLVQCQSENLLLNKEAGMQAAAAPAVLACQPTTCMSEW
jgi:hypothetical protein